MSELNENMGEIIEDLTYPVETPTEEIIELPPQRVNPFCVISKGVFIVTDINDKEHKFHMIETNSSWGENPYGEDYAVVPDELVADILETRGFVDIELNKDGTEVVNFKALEVPEISVAQSEPSQLDLIEAQVTYTALMTDTLLEG